MSVSYKSALQATVDYEEACVHETEKSGIFDNESIHIQRDEMWETVLRTIASGNLSANQAQTLAQHALLSGIHDGFWFA